MTSRVLLLGYGLAGRIFHSRLIAAEPDLEITGIVTADPQRRAEAEQDHPGVRLFADADEAWSHASEFDLAVVATANSAHVPQATAALESGLHVVVDKPLAGTADEAEQLIDIAQRVDRQLHVFQNRRWDSEILTTHQVIASGLIGRPHRLESRFERFRPNPKGGWREEGGAADLPGLLYDLGAHLVDQALHLMGPANRVAASARTVRDGVTADDDTQLLLWHVEGAVSVISVSSISAFIEPRLRLLGTRGGLQIVGLDSQEDALRAGQSPLDEGWGQEPDSSAALIVTEQEPLPRVYPRARGSWPDYYAGVARSIRDGAPPPVNPRDVVANLRVIEAAALSSREQREVSLDPPAGHAAR